MKTAGLDRPLASVAFVLILYGIVVMYSAGQTDVATSAAGVWHRQFVWLGIGLVVGFAAGSIPSIHSPASITRA
jgi:cell division protein FtsW (lipid II flippase)